MKISKYIFIVLLLVNVRQLYAVRPFITDDAEVVGHRLFQWENWLKFDNTTGQYWHLFAYGPHSNVELTFGGVFGYEVDDNDNYKFAYALPLMEIKWLFYDYEPGVRPGISTINGTFLPNGRGDLAPPDYGFYSYFALTHSFNSTEDVIIHANLGADFNNFSKKAQTSLTWGIGSQIRLYQAMHGVVELISGDPYIAESGISFQVGFRYFVSDFLQFDATFGEGLTGKHKEPRWFSAGARIVSSLFR